MQQIKKAEKQKKLQWVLLLLNILLAKHLGQFRYKKVENQQRSKQIIPEPWTKVQTNNLQQRLQSKHRRF